MITVRINGQAREIAAGLSVEQLLGQLGLPAVGTLVERNGAALFPREFGTTPLEPEDRLELVRIAAGG